MISYGDCTRISLNPRYTVRVIEIRVVMARGARCYMPPVTSLRCSRLLNRVLGILFNSDSRAIPREVRNLFKIST